MKRIKLIKYRNVNGIDCIKNYILKVFKVL